MKIYHPDKRLLKAKLRLFLTDYAIAMVTHYVKKIPITCSPILKLLSGTVIIVVSGVIKSVSIDPSKCKCKFN